MGLKSCQQWKGRSTADGLAVGKGYEESTRTLISRGRSAQEGCASLGLSEVQYTCPRNVAGRDVGTHRQAIPGRA